MDAHEVFYSHAKLALEIDARFNAMAHSHSQLCRTTANKIGRFLDLNSNPMT
jgi:hypothetical protein